MKLVAEILEEPLFLRGLGLQETPEEAFDPIDYHSPLRTWMIKRRLT